MIVIYTDGSARQKGKLWIGAYAYAIYHNGKAIYQASLNLTPAAVNLCELTAVAHALYTSMKLYPDEPVQIYTDSQYVIDGVSNPLHVKTNKKCWALIQQLMVNRDIKFFHVKSHHTDVRNNHVDHLAKSKLRSQF